MGSATYQKGPQAVTNPSQNLSIGAAAVFVPLNSINLIELNTQIAEPLAPSGARVYPVPPENNQVSAQLHLVQSMMKHNPNVMLSIALLDNPSGLKNFVSKILHGVTSAAKWVAPVLHKVMVAVSGPIGTINPTAGMIARGIGGAAGMANMFLI
ncbi:MAG: hypothetical protein EZS28_019757 [Streblomastix strix]|uniref:Uncharacterized protein n=1 Tax=Streblomastix strix TaxID=222440 RepID=A0A5J4VR31_9EUKA|nr:MAG: hypothetical protein EZS28_019757 [Streblomastix strix]